MIRTGDWVFIKGGGCGRVTGFEESMVVVEMDYVCEVLFPPEKIAGVVQRQQASEPNPEAARAS
jgi:preprotein translocase subunit YajC